MNRSIDWFARNHVAANLLMLLLVGGGLLILPTVRQELLPDIAVEMVSVSVPYPGASPEEVEQSVVIPVEQALEGLSGVKRLRSTAGEGLATVTVELLTGEDVSRRLADVRARVDAIDTLPDETERPTVSQLQTFQGVLVIAVSGDADERTLKRAGQQIRDELLALPGISEVSLSATRDSEITIEVSEETLLQHGLDFDDITAALRRSSLDLPGGTIRARGGEVLLRAQGKATDRRAFERIALVSRADGTRLSLGDVARVIDGFEDSSERARFDGKPAVLVNVGRAGDQRLLEVAATAEAFVAEARRRMPAGIELTIWQSTANLLGDRIGSMVANARAGFVLVALVLAVFLRTRLAFWVALGIPTAFLGALAVMPVLGVSINWISLLGFIVVLGIVVDDAIVVGENAHTEQTRTHEPLEGAIRGAQILSVPVVFGVLTTVAAFAPMLFIPGAMGKLVSPLPMVVIACLLFSLVEAMWVLPSHLGHYGSARARARSPGRAPVFGAWRRLQDRVAHGLDVATRVHYRHAVERAIEHRGLTLAAAVSVLLLTLGLLGGGWLRFTFQEPVEGDLITAGVELPPGTSAELTEAALLRIESAAREIQRRADADAPEGAPSIFRHLMVSLGSRPSQQMGDPIPRGGAPSGGNHLGEVSIEMAAPEHRHVGTEEMQRRLRAQVGSIPGAELSFANSMIKVGAPVELELRGEELATLSRVADQVRARLSEMPGVHDVRDSFRGGKQELRFQVLPSAEALGLTLADVARQVRQAFHGEEVQTLQRGREETQVVVRYPQAERRSLSDVERMWLRTPEGLEVPFSSVARAELGRGYAAISRVDRRRVVTVTADVDVSVTSASLVIEELRSVTLPRILDVVPGITFSFEGEQAEQREFLGAMARGQAIALLVIFGLLAIPLRSYLQPLLIMSAIPFGLVGAAIGHVLLGYDFSMYSVIGLVALSGVVVNASLVLVDHANRLHEKGLPLDRAVVESGVARLRPILLTSVTTFAGLSPMLLEQSLSARFMVPMAISLAFGVLFAGAITLFLLPCATLALDDVQCALRGARARASARLRDATGDEAEHPV
ncbi:MAG: efflux RND transporter permease subunit [Myxococcota bacterium]|nr:efflux RND transporter permease subunit [Myxococcota bacterium]